MDTLAFGYILPTTGWIPDFHRLETCTAGRTVKKDSGRNDRSLLFRNLYLVTQMDYFAFPTEIADFLYPHLLNTFFPSLDVLL